MIDKISINGTLYAVTPVPEGEQPSGSTVTVDGVTYLIGAAITAPAEMAQQAIEKIQVNGVLYDIADVEAVGEETRRATEAERVLAAAINANANNLAETKKDIANQLIVTPGADKVSITGRNMQSMRLNFEADIPAATTKNAGAMSAEDKKKVNASIKNIDVSPNVGDVELDLENNAGRTFHVVFPEATAEKAGVMTAEDKKEQVKKTPLVTGDIIVGQAREVYSRQGKVDSATFLKRTTAGGTSVSDGVASVKQIGGNIVKNLIDINAINVWGSATYTINNIINVTNTDIYCGVRWAIDDMVEGHKYYLGVDVCNAENVFITLQNYNDQTYYINTGYTGTKSHIRLSACGTSGYTKNNLVIRNRIVGDFQVVPNLILLDLTEMFGAGNEPTKEECDRMFGTMGALPKGLTIAQPTGLKSTGFNQWNPTNVLLNKSIVDNAIEDDVADRHIAIVECLPCKIGTGENNGYIIGYGEGDSWSEADIEVYFSPLNPMDYIGQEDVNFYIHKLEMSADYGTYVPQCKGYLLIVTPTTEKLCVHFHWSGDREITDYEEYVESNVVLPTIPEMSEYGLAGIQSNGTLICDEIDFEKGVYIKRVGCVDLGSLKWGYNPNDVRFYTTSKVEGMAKGNGFNLKPMLCSKYSVGIVGITPTTIVDKLIANNQAYIYIRDVAHSSVSSFTEDNKGVMLYYELETPEEYPIVTKAAPNYIGSDYGVEEFMGSKVPLNANVLFYMRSLVGEIRNFIDRLYTNTIKTDTKEVADYITNGIESNKELATNAPNLALRALFVAAGAEYNDSDDDKTKTAPWGETVTHKSGHYYLNGLGDITEEQMNAIYNRGNFGDNDKAALAYSNGVANKIRTNLPRVGLWNGVIQSFLCAYNSVIETVTMHVTNTEPDACAISISDSESLFESASNLSVIDTRCVLKSSSWKSSSFKGCKVLKEVRIRNLKSNISFANSPLLSKATVLYMIQNATPTSAITITLHPDAYARLAEDTDIVAALEAQPLVTLVSA